jgi:hypothetical protein
MLLPFVNGVMLGFGEIFAKNVVVGWFGWKKVPGPWTASSMSGRTKRGTADVGIGIPRPAEQNMSRLSVRQ